IWRGLTGGRSVHLTDWPVASDLPSDEPLVAAMDRAREICSTALGLRKADALESFGAVVADEVNVRTVTLVDVASASEADFGISQKLTVNARAAGPRL